MLSWLKGARFTRAHIATIGVSVGMALACGPSERVGSVGNVCPELDGIGVDGVERRVGSTITLDALAVDPDNGPAPLEYRWTASAGTIDNPTAKTVKLVCDAPGPVTISLAVSDGDSTNCHVSNTRSINCLPRAPLSALGHLVVIYLENHSVDSLYGSYPGAEGLSSANALIPQIDKDTGLPYPTLPTVFDKDLPNRPFDITRYLSEYLASADLAHEYYGEQRQINDGRMDKFVTWGGAAGLPVGYYPTEKLPLFQLMRNVPDRVTMCDHFFHAAFGGSFLNHFWLIAARTPVFPNAPDALVAKMDDHGNWYGDVTPDGYAVNTRQTVNTPHSASEPLENLLPSQTFPNIGDRLNAAGVDWAWYSEGWNDAIAGQPAWDFSFHHQTFAYFADYAEGTALRAQHLKDEQDFQAGLASGTLPPVSFVKPKGANNEHPGYPLIEGERYAANLVRSIMKSALWKDTVVIVAYDENGGFWDHVPPPMGDRWGPGTRVPAMVFSPFANGGVDSTPYDTTAILKLIEKRWNLAPLGDRDAAQADMSTNSLSFAASAESLTEPVLTILPDSLGGTNGEVSAFDAEWSNQVADLTPAAPIGPRGTWPSLVNRFAYIPPQCYAKTRRAERVTNSCYPCHQHATAPNFVEDADLQLRLRFPRGAAHNPWQNVMSPPVLRQERRKDDDVLAYVRESNYFDEFGAIALAAKLRALPAAWDTEGDCQWNGYVPDAWFHFDEQGFDVGPDGRETGWRAFAYYPMPGAFAPTNGSMDDVLIRLDSSLREDETGRANRRIYEINLAIVEALITRRDVPIEPVDEVALKVDLDRDGTLGLAARVAFDALPNGDTRMQYVGRARVAAPERPLPVAPGLYPPGTEFLHSVRYLDIGKDATVVMAPRMKELRYARKTNWLSPRDLEASTANETIEQQEWPGGARRVRWLFDPGVHNGRGWVLQGFIEASDGSLRPQTYEESASCAGCHGGIGATTDSTFALPRKVVSGPARGWFHWTQHGLGGLGEPERPDGAGEYAFFLHENGGGDDFGDNAEVRAKFFDDRGRLRRDMLARLRDDVAEFLLPSAARALDLDRAYRAIVVEQSFSRGRDAILGATPNVHNIAPIGATTAVVAPAVGGLRK